jgi:hypothetical protein
MDQTTEYPRIDRVLQELHDSEINGGISWFYDGCWRVVLGDKLNGYDAAAPVSSIEEAVEWLVKNAIWQYPNSVFADKYRHLVPDPDRLAHKPSEDVSDLAGEDDDATDPVAEDGPADFIEILLQQGPGPESDFIEALDENGKPITNGEWVRRSDGIWAFRIPVVVAEEQPPKAEPPGFV